MSNKASDILSIKSGEDTESLPTEGEAIIVKIEACHFSHRYSDVYSIWSPYESDWLRNKREARRTWYKPAKAMPALREEKKKSGK